jgi:hypothetical protein
MEKIEIKFKIRRKYKCKYCKRELTGRKKRFCGSNCSSKWRYRNLPAYNLALKRRSRKQYQSQKGNPKFKADRKRRFNDWLENNREHFNDLCRINCREYERKKRARRRRLKVCILCGGKRTIGYKSCESCRDIQNKNEHKLRNKRKKLGLCSACGKIRINHMFINCEICRKKHQDWKRRTKHKI